MASASASASGSAAHGSVGSVGSVTVGENATNAQRETLETVLKDRTSEGGAPTKKYSSVAGDTCTWYANEQCVQPRSCYDCLNTWIAGSKCMIDNNGVCVSMSKYDVHEDFRRNTSASISNPGKFEYPSTNTTYCSDNDKYCNICRDSWTNPFDNSQVSYLRYCRGVGGCVCIQNCESTYRNDNVILNVCKVYGYSAPSSKTVYTSVGIMATLCFVFLIVTIVVRRWARKAFHDRVNRRVAFRHDMPLPQRQPTGPRLGLSGWLSMREKLIETEREEIKNSQNQTLAMPVIDNTLGPAVAIDAVDVYLPASPSDLLSRQRRPTTDARDSEGRPRSASEPTARTTGIMPRPANATTLNEL